MPSSAIKKKRNRRRKKKSSTTIDVPFYATIPQADLDQRAAEDVGEDMQVEYVVQTDVDGLEKPEFSDFAEILNKQEFNPFAKDNEEEEVVDMEEEDGEAEEEQNKASLSKKQRKREKRDKIEVLKLLSDHPEIVEIHDVNASYPWLLVYLKGYRNTVPVPRHWCQRRKYLQGKRGIEKVQYELPDFIRNTGIADIRQAVLEKEDSQKLKQKARDRLQPKMGKIDIDYHVLYDAFFRHQTKPNLTGHSDVYYEGKEYEVNLKERKPGQLSKELRRALGMPEGGLYPPPWLVNMQRHGPPPAYPHLKIPGVNAPVPPGAKLGTHPGAWGQPPVDSYGRPIYSSDWSQINSVSKLAEPIEYESWGLVEDQDESDDEYEDMQTVAEEQSEFIEPEETSQLPSSEMESGVASNSGFETPDAFDLRKQKIDPKQNSNTQPKQLYQELKQEESSVGGSLFGSQHRYVMPKEDKVTLIGAKKSERMEVSLNPSELESESGITEDLIRKKYDDTLQLEKQSRRKEDMSDMVAEESARRKRKDKQKTYRF